MEKIKVYLIARISEDAHPWNEKITGVLKDPIEVFIPHKHNPYNIQHTKLPKEVYDVDLAAMEEAHIGLALPEFGCDCAFEVGWFSHSTKPTVFYVDTQTEWLRNWMVKGGLDYVVTNNADTYRILKEDPILKFKQIIIMKSLGDFDRVIKDIHQETYPSNFSGERLKVNSKEV